MIAPVSMIERSSQGSRLACAMRSGTCLGISSMKWLVYAVATSQSKRYLPNLSKQAAIREWRPSLRYQPSGEVAPVQAQAMLKEALDTYTRTVRQMYLDGVL